VEFKVASVVVNALEFVCFKWAISKKFADFGEEHSLVVKGTFVTRHAVCSK
jgi:hypothetical protein